MSEKEKKTSSTKTTKTKKETSTVAFDGMNTVEIRGRIVQKMRTGTALVMVIATVNPVTQKTDFPRTVAFDNIDAYDASFTVGQRVTITAAIQTSKKYPEGTIVIHDIAEEQSRMDAEFSGDVFLPDCNKVLIKGIVSGKPYTPSKTVTILPVKISDGERIAYPRIVFFGALASRAALKEEDTPVQILGHVQNSNREVNGVKQRHQSIIAQNIR